MPPDNLFLLHDRHSSGNKVGMEEQNDEEEVTVALDTKKLASLALPLQEACSGLTAFEQAFVLNAVVLMVHGDRAKDFLEVAKEFLSTVKEYLKSLVKEDQNG